MTNFLELVSIREWVRMVMLFAHLMVAAWTLTTVLVADFSIVTGRFTREGVYRTACLTTWLLLALWISGLALIYIDTGFDPAVLATRSKLVIKLLCVVVLTINGFALHGFSFNVLTGSGRLRGCHLLLLAITGAVSTSHWLMAAFVGVAKPLGKLPINVLLAGYVVACTTALMAGLAYLPHMRSHLLRWRVQQAAVTESVAFREIATNAQSQHVFSSNVPSRKSDRHSTGTGITTLSTELLDINLD